MKGLAQDEINHINKLYNSGLTMVEVAKKTHHSSCVVCKYAFNPRDQGPKRKFDIKQLQILNEKYDSGLTMEALGAEYDMPYQTIRNYIWEPRHRGKLRKIV